MKSSTKRITYTLIVTLIVVFSTTFAILMTLERMDYRNYLQGEYSKNMYELITSIENIRVNLSKAAIVGSREQSIVVFEEIFRHSSFANDKLHSLPIPVETVSNTSKFISQVGDFSYSLIKISTEGGELTKGDYENLENLKVECYELEERLNKLLGEINEGKVQWGEIRKKASGVLAKSNEKFLSTKFKEIQKQVAQYPALIYDGPFSDNIVDIKPKVNNLEAVDEKTAKKVVEEALKGRKINKIELRKNEGKTRIDSYSFNVTLEGKEKPNIVCEVSKKGGKIVYLLDSRDIEKPTMDAKKAIDLGKKYLEKMGYKNMKTMYTMGYSNSIVVSYVYEQGEVIIYPDQIKLKVALDNGDIIGVESEKYLVSHVASRKIGIPKVSELKAKERVGKNLKINSVRLAVVPTETNKEVLCYEFSGSYKGDNFLVYINANTGYEQKILQVINTPNGQLTM